MIELWSKIEAWILKTPEIFGINVGYFLILLAILVITVFVRWILVSVIVKALEKLSKRTETELDDLIIEALRKTLGWIIITIGLLIAYLAFSGAIKPDVDNLRVDLRPKIEKQLKKEIETTVKENNPHKSSKEIKELIEAAMVGVNEKVDERLAEAVKSKLGQFKNIHNIIINILASLIILSVAWLLWRLVSNLAKYFEKKAEETESKLDDQIVPIARKFFKILIASIAIGMILSNFGVDITGIIAGLGIFGFAFAIAAQDTLGNMFGSATLFGAKPFQVGDFIKYGDIEGIVEEIGIRSTKIRKFDRHLVLIPNSNLAKGIVENVSCRGNMFRVREKIGLTYDSSPSQIENFTEDVRQMILNHKYTNKDSFYVYFVNYGDSCLEILIQFFLELPGFPEYMKEKHNIMLDIMRLVGRMGLEFAFPSMTLYKYDNNLEKDTNDNKNKYSKYLRMKREQKRIEELKKLKDSEKSEEEKQEEIKQKLEEKEKEIQSLKEKIEQEEEEFKDLKKELGGEEEEEKTDDEKKVEEGLAKGGHIEEDE
jgi:MscS family membrane protein